VWRNLCAVTPAGSGCCPRSASSSSARLIAGPVTRLAMSWDALIEQLSSSAGSGFTDEQAVYAADKVY
jgi:Host cell surface-exposed lipoprotein